MKIAENAVVSIEYTLKDDKGTVLDASEKGEPLVYMHGGGQIIPGLEQALEGKAAGESLTVRVAPADGYGEREPEAVFEVPRAKLPAGVELKVGLELANKTREGHVMRFRVAEVHADHIVADANHPLAGEHLNFQVTIARVRAATKEELAHGHAHGEGGHHHHH